MKKRKRAGLPRLTILTMSAKDLQRFSDAAERITAVAADLSDILSSMHASERRSEAARKANATRRTRKAGVEDSLDLNVAQRLVDEAEKIGLEATGD